MHSRKSFWLPCLTTAILGVAAANCGDDSTDECTPGSVGCIDPSATGPTTATASGLTATTSTTSTTSDSTDTDVGSTSATTGEPETGGSEEGGPKILQFLTNVKQITEGEAVLFTAVVTDPDGVEDLIGGSLTSTDGQISFGAFATDGQEGSYSLSISWAEIHQADKIQFETPSIIRTFRAEFFDQGGKSAWTTVDITLSCDDGVRVTPGACDSGQCTDLDSDDVNCSHCGTECNLWMKNSDVGSCMGGACSPTYYGCVSFVDFVNCNEQCATFGETCVVGGCDGNTSYDGFSMCTDVSFHNDAHACEDSDVSSSATSCCCTQTI